MVLLSLVPRRPNNTASRYFPHSGYLGLTPVSISGSVKTRLIDDDRKFLPAKRITITVRCYEARLFKLGNDITSILVDEQQTLWECPGGAECTGIGNLDLPFKIILPPTIGGHSSCHLPDYKVFWRVEAVIHHIPLTGVGSRQTKFLELNLLRHHSPSPLPLPFPISHSLRLPSAAYSLITPSHQLGPGDRIPISLKLLPTHADTSVSRVLVSIERRIDFKDPNKASALRTPSGNSTTDSIASDPSPSPLPTPPPTANLADNSGNIAKDAKSKGKDINLDMFASSMLKATKRTSAFFGSTPPDQPTLAENISMLKPGDGTPDSQTSIFAFNVPATPTTKAAASYSKASSQILATMSLDKSELVVKKDGETGGLAYGADLTATLPIPKAGHWGMGETLSTILADVRFFVCVKVYLVTTLASSSSQETLLLSPQEITVVAVDDHQRSEVKAKIRETARARIRPSKSSSSKTKAHYLPSSSPSGREYLAPPTVSPEGTSKSRRRGQSASPARPVDGHSPPSPPSSPSPPPSPISHQASDLDDDETLNSDDKTPRQSPAPANTTREPGSTKQVRTRGMELDMDGDFYQSLATESESTLVSQQGRVPVPALPIGLPGPSSSHHPAPPTPDEDISPFAWDIISAHEATPSEYDPSASRMSLDEPEVDVHAVLGGDLSFTRTLRTAPTTRQPSTLKSPSSKMIKLPRGLLLTSSKSKRSSPAPSGAPASRGTGAKLVAATRSMRITSSSISFRDDTSGDPLRPRTSSGIPFFDRPEQPTSQGYARAGSVGAVPVRSSTDGRSSFQVESRGSPGPESPSFIRGHGRGGAGSLLSGSFAKLSPLSPLLTTSSARTTILKPPPTHQEQREWEDELEKIVSSSKRKTEEVAHRHQNAAKMRMSVDSAATVKPGPSNPSRRPTADVVAAANLSGLP